MKPLISVLAIIVAAVSAQAQSRPDPLVEAARKERDRQAQIKSTIEFTDSNSHGITGGNVTTATASVPAEKPVPAAEKSSESAPDPLLVKEEKILKLRERVKDLENQETALKLQINDFTNQVFAPVTTQIAKDDAQKRLGDAQAQLIDLQTELTHARADVQELLNSPLPK
jgi:chromosome segregation ATPase